MVRAAAPNFPNLESFKTVQFSASAARLFLLAPRKLLCVIRGSRRIAKGSLKSIAADAWLCPGLSIHTRIRYSHTPGWWILRSGFLAPATKRSLRRAEEFARASRACGRRVKRLLLERLSRRWRLLPVTAPRRLRPSRVTV